MIAIIDYGMGNIHSVRKVIESFGQNTIVALTKNDLKGAEGIILPGVGAFADAMGELKKRNLDSAITEQIKNRKPFLGICLGMQLLFNESYEGAGSKGLGILVGVVNKFKPIRHNLKIPHIGWNQLSKVTKSPSSAKILGGPADLCGGHQVTSECPLLKDIPDNSYVYFCHSYYVLPQDKDIIAATTDYGMNFASVVWKDNIFGIQFHPEKSQRVGLKILENFVNLC